jgi:AcrR family transcriptional regulator
MSPVGGRQAQRKAETRAELLSAARAEFCDRGFHRASVQRIAHRAGFTTGAIYAHFANKDELFLAVYEQFALTRIGELGETRMSTEGDLGSRSRALADRWMSRHAEHPTFTIVALEFAVHAIRTPHLRDALAARHAAVRLWLAWMLDEEARAAGMQLPMAPIDIATVLRELGVGLALAQLVDPDAVSQQLYGDFVETFCEMAAR